MCSRRRKRRRYRYKGYVTYCSLCHIICFLRLRPLGRIFSPRGYPGCSPVCQCWVITIGRKAFRLVFLFKFTKNSTLAHVKLKIINQSDQRRVPPTPFSLWNLRKTLPKQFSENRLMFPFFVPHLSGSKKHPENAALVLLLIEQIWLFGNIQIVNDFVTFFLTFIEPYVDNVGEIFAPYCVHSNLSFRRNIQ